MTMFVVQGVLIVALGLSPQRSEALDKTVQFDSKRCSPWLTTADVECKLDVHVLIGDSVELAMAKDFASIPEVRYVLTEQVEGPLLVWIAADNPEPEVRMRIYQKEMELIEGFPEVDFDFNLIPSMGRSPEEIASGARVVYSR